MNTYATSSKKKDGWQGAGDVYLQAWLSTPSDTQDYSAIDLEIRRIFRLVGSDPQVHVTSLPESESFPAS